MKTQIYLVRHGKTAWNEKKKLQGWKDIPLSKTGIEEARSAAEKLKDIPVHAIYTSPLKRAYKTAEEINRYHQLSVRTVDGLKEAGFGVFEGLTWEKLMQHPLVLSRPANYERYHDKTGGGESIHDVYLRVSAVLDSIVAMQTRN